MKDLLYRIALKIPFLNNLIRNRVRKEMEMKERMRVERNAKRIMDWNIAEYNLIQQKKSKLSAKSRRRVEEFVRKLVDQGVIKIND